MSSVGSHDYPDAVTTSEPVDGAAPPPAADPVTAKAPRSAAASGRPAAQGVFITFEGGDGVGKTTQLRLLAEWLTDHGRAVVTTREPGGTVLGTELRNAVLHGDHVSPRTEALLYATDRAHHVDTVVRPALTRGDVVLSDRYLDSSVAYQGNGRDLGADEVERLSLWATEGLLPDLTVLLDLDPAVGLRRLTGEPDRLERAGADFHVRTREAFLRRAASGGDRWLVVDASAPVDHIQAAIRRRVEHLLESGSGAGSEATPTAPRGSAGSKPSALGAHGTVQHHARTAP